ncbi:MAG: enoyl-CoA hydratase-related protein [Alphaproteobacteria bacterium]|jgi:enoyl-CoA hydratase/carnithine racemase
MTPFADGRLILHQARVARIEINAPDRRNAMSRAMWHAIPLICDRIEADPGIRAVLLTGAAEVGATFSAGADITEFEDVYATSEATTAYNAMVRRAQARLRILDRPVIAVVAGACVGGGCGLALAADLRFAAPEARFGITAARLGLGYSPEDTAQLMEKVGPARAKDLLFSARLIAAEEALAIGLIERILPAATLLQEATNYADGLAELSSLSIRATKAAINQLTSPDAAVCADLNARFVAGFESLDFKEGCTAFMNRKKPVFD